MWKKVFLMQICICLFIVTGYVSMDKTESVFLHDKRSKAVAALSKNYLVSDVFSAGRDAVAALVKTPATITGHIINGREYKPYAEPIDPVVEGVIASVYSVNGGQVCETGENNEFGRYIKIQHDGAVSVYGNCSRIYVKEGKHVRRGQVIGSYMPEKNKQFYYELIEE